MYCLYELILQYKVHVTQNTNIQSNKYSLHWQLKERGCQFRQEKCQNDVNNKQTKKCVKNISGEIGRCQKL